MVGIKTTVWLLTLLCLTGCSAPPESAERSSEAESLEHVKEQVNSPRSYQEHPAFGTLWPTEFTARALADTAMSKAYAFYQREPGSQPFRVFIDPDIPQEDQSQIEELVISMTSPFSAYIFDELDIIIGVNTKYLDRIVEEYELPKPFVGYGVPCAFAQGSCSFQSTVWHASPGLSSVDSVNQGFVLSFAHKITHGFQDGIDKNSAGQIPPRSSENFRPAWFTEGIADFHAYAIADYLGFGAYRTQDTANLLDWELRSLEEWGGPSKDLVYFVGRIAVEYIVANVGFEGLMAIYLALHEGLSFEDAFVQGTGISLDEFYDYFEAWSRSDSSAE